MQRYEKYKDSGVDWLGEIPEHWDVKRLKNVFQIFKRIAGELGHNVLSITQNGIKVKDITSGEGQLAMDYSKYQLAYEGDFAMNQMDLLTGWVDISKFNGVISPDYRVFNLINKSNNPEYFLNLLQDCYRSRVFYKHGQGVSMMGRWRFPTENFNNFHFPLPPLLEQKAIVEFLNDKCEKIDAAVNLKEQQIEKLKELRQITIHNAVTKGIPHFDGEVVPMKHSGIDWIGEIPEHWKVKRLKNELNYFKGFAFSSTDFSEEGVGIVKASNIKRFSIKNITSFIKPNNQRLEFERFRIAFGDIIISTVGSKPEIIESAVGQLAFVEKEFSNLYLNQNTVCFRLINPSNSNLFFKYLFQSRYIREYFNKISLWIANQAYLEIDEILNIPLFLPPLSEQEEIAAYLEEQTTKIDKAIVQKQEQIVKLKEYKQSLINEAVTGKIKITA